MIKERSKEIGDDKMNLQLIEELKLLNIQNQKNIEELKKQNIEKEEQVFVMT